VTTGAVPIVDLATGTGIAGASGGDGVETEAVVTDAVAAETVMHEYYMCLQSVGTNAIDDALDRRTFHNSHYRFIALSEKKPIFI